MCMISSKYTYPVHQGKNQVLVSLLAFSLPAYINSNVQEALSKDKKGMPPIGNYRPVRKFWGLIFDIWLIFFKIFPKEFTNSKWIFVQISMD